MIGIRIHANLHTLRAKVEPDLNGFVLKLDAGANIVEIKGTAQQIEEIERACREGLEADFVKHTPIIIEDEIPDEIRIKTPEERQ